MVTGNLPFASQNCNHRLLIEEVSDFQYPKSMSPMLIDLLRQIFTIRPSDRPDLLHLQSHPWLRGMPQLGLNISPQPIVFYRVPRLQNVLKFKRRSVKPDPKVLESCVSLGINTEELTNKLKNGVTDADTTFYFILLHPLVEKPELPTAPSRGMPPIIPGSRNHPVSAQESIELPLAKARVDSLPRLYHKNPAVVPVAAAESPTARRSSSRSVGPMGQTGRLPLRRPSSGQPPSGRRRP
jgi:hypothetical protein